MASNAAAPGGKSDTSRKPPVIKNPLLSSQVTGLTLDDFAPVAVLLPAAPLPAIAKDPSESTGQCKDERMRGRDGELEMQFATTWLHILFITIFIIFISFGAHQPQSNGKVCSRIKVQCRFEDIPFCQRYRCTCGMGDSGNVWRWSKATDCL